MQKGAQRGNSRWEIQNNALSVLLPGSSQAYLQVGVQVPNVWWGTQIKDSEEVRPARAVGGGGPQPQVPSR